MEFTSFRNAAIKLGPKIARRVALAVTDDGSIEMERYVALCGDLEAAELLLQENIFVDDDAGMVGFDNTILESTIKQHIEQQSKVPNWDLGRIFGN